MHPKHMFKLMGKKIITILRSESFLIGPMLILSYTHLLSIRFMLDVSLQCGTSYDFGDDTLHGRNVGFSGSSHRIIAFACCFGNHINQPMHFFLAYFFTGLMPPC